MKEVKEAYTYIEEQVLTKNEKAHINAMQQGAGSLIFLIALAYGVYHFLSSANFFFLEVPLMEPWYFVTHPIWLIPTLFLANFSARNIIYIIMSILTVISLPFLCFLSLATIYGSGFFYSYNDILPDFYSFAYGEYGRYLEHFIISLKLSGEHELFMKGVTLTSSIALLISFIFFYRLCFDAILLLSKKGRPLELNRFWEFLKGVAIVLLTYYALYPLMSLTHASPLGVGYLVTWSVLFYPFLAVRLALTNAKRNTQDKVGVAVTYYYIAFGVLIMPLSLYLTGSLAGVFNAALSGEASAIMVFFPVLLTPLLIRSLKDKSK